MSKSIYTKGKKTYSVSDKITTPFTSIIGIRSYTFKRYDVDYAL